MTYSYTSTHKHAVTTVGSTNYTYDANGNMITRGTQTLTWDVENKPTSVSYNGTTAQFFYDGDGNRVKKIENGETILYINRYCEVNITTGNVTSSYYLGGQLVATSENGTLRYIHQDSLTSTSLMTDSTGAQTGTTMKYLPFGGTRSGSVPTDKLFTGQRLDSTGLYYYNARYYDATIGRFISPDTVISNPANPQCFNRYSYCLNNPLRYIDPSGHDPYMDLLVLQIKYNKGKITDPQEITQTITKLSAEITLSQTIPIISPLGSPYMPLYQYEKQEIYKKNNLKIFHSEGGFYEIIASATLIATDAQFDEMISLGYSFNDLLALADGIQFQGDIGAINIWKIELFYTPGPQKYKRDLDGSMIPESEFVFPDRPGSDWIYKNTPYPSSIVSKMYFSIPYSQKARSSISPTDIYNFYIYGSKYSNWMGAN